MAKANMAGGWKEAQSIRPLPQKASLTQFVSTGGQGWRAAVRKNSMTDPEMGPPGFAVMVVVEVWI